MRSLVDAWKRKLTDPGRSDADINKFDLTLRQKSAKL